MSVPGGSPAVHPTGGITSTLQAILQFSDGGMESIAAPIPLPEAIVLLQAVRPLADPTLGQGTDGARRFVERRFRRARSPDSVIRYIEISGPSSTSAARDADQPEPERNDPRRCARCCRFSRVYYVPKLMADESVTERTAAYCDQCYAAVISTAPASDSGR